MPPTRLGRRLKALRQAKGWTQMELARRAGLKTPSHVSLLETGGRRSPAAVTVVKLAKALSVPVTELLQ